MEVDQPATDPQEQQLAKLRQKATLLISKIDPATTEALHRCVRGLPGMVGAASVAAVLADIICHLSKTEDGVNSNALVVSEMILRIAAAGFKNKPDHKAVH